MKIVLENLSKSYYAIRKVETKALKDITTEIRPGEIVAVTGPSGAGKSTLLHLIGLMDAQSGGKLSFDGKDLKELSDGERAKIRNEKIGFLFQMHYLMPDFNVLENVLLPVWDKRKDKLHEAHSILSGLGLNERLTHYPSELSGGEQQRAALARSLINQPELLLCDEPTGDLDRETGKKVEDLIFGESSKRNMTLIVVTHNNELAEKADRIIKLKDGSLAS